MAAHPKIYGARPLPPSPVNTPRTPSIPRVALPVPIGRMRVAQLIHFLSPGGDL